MPGLILIGLGPGDPGLLTCDAREVFTHIKRVFCFGNVHAAYQVIPEDVERVNLTGKIGMAEGEMLDDILPLSTNQDAMVFVFPGDPLVDSRIGRRILKEARARKLSLKVIPGVSQLSTIIQSSDAGQTGRIVLVDAHELVQRKVPGFPPDLTAVISPVDDAEIACLVGTVLKANYPGDHTIQIIKLINEGMQIENIKLVHINADLKLGEGSLLLVPPRTEKTSFESFQEVVARLRAPDGCPWDREQTHLSLRRHLLEESYETLEAIDSGSMDDLREELGDLLLQIVLNSQIASENGDFKMSDVLEGINAKIINRHPHVFARTQVDGVGGVLKNWEKLKEKERQSNGDMEKGLLDGAPASLPALAYAHEIQDRAARIGFDWPEIDGVIAKVREELEEVLSAEPGTEQEKEIGDLAFAVVNLARWLKVDPESALRETNKRFKQRFSFIEESARKRGLSLSDLSFDEMDQLWEQAKKLE